MVMLVLSTPNEILNTTHSAKERDHHSVFPLVPKVLLPPLPSLQFLNSSNLPSFKGPFLTIMPTSHLLFHKIFFCYCWPSNFWAQISENKTTYIYIVPILTFYSFFYLTSAFTIGEKSSDIFIKFPSVLFFLDQLQHMTTRTNLTDSPPIG